MSNGHGQQVDRQGGGAIVVPNQRHVVTELDAINAQMPAFMAEHSGEGTQGLDQFIRPPRLKVVQNQSLGAYRENYSPGDVLLMPDYIHIASHVRGKPGQPGSPATLWFTPLLYFVEWIHTKPNSGNSAEFLQGRTLDPADDIAIRSRDTRTRQYEIDSQKYMFLEVINFIVLLHGCGVDGMPVVMSFLSAEHRSGETLASKIRQRRVKGPNGELVQAPIYGSVFQATLADRTNSKGAWYGWDCDNPTVESGVRPWIDDVDLYVSYRARHLELAEALQARMLVADYDDATAATSPDGADVHGKYGQTIEGHAVSQPAF